jgi:hypothetical protein
VANKQKLLKALGYLAENTSVAAFPDAWRSCFYDCTNLNEVSAALLPAVPNGTSDIFANMFSGCSSLAASINDLITAHVMSGVRLNASSYNMSRTFQNCSKLTGSAQTAINTGFGGAVPSSDRGTFYGCSSLDLSDVAANWQ